MSAQHLLAALFNAGIAISVGATVLPLALAVELGQRAAGRNQRPGSSARAAAASPPSSR